MTDRLIGEGRILKTELDFLVEAIRTMREIRLKDGFQAGEAFQKKMEEYFRLNFDMRKTFVYDELLRLADTPSGSMQQREDLLLQRIHRLQPGERFEIDGRVCIVERHMRIDPSDLRNGFMEYTYSGTTNRTTLDYNSLWNLATEGRLIFG